MTLALRADCGVRVCSSADAVESLPLPGLVRNDDRFRSDRCGMAGYRASINPQLLQLVPERAEGDAEFPGGGGLVVAGFFQRLDDGVALDVGDVVIQSHTAAIAVIG